MIKDKNKTEQSETAQIPDAPASKKPIKIIIKIILLIVFTVVAFFAVYPIQSVHFKDGITQRGGTKVWYSQAYVIISYNLYGEDVKIYPIPYDLLISGKVDSFADLVVPDNLWDRYEAQSRGKNYYEREHQDPPYSGAGGIDEITNQS